MKLFRTFLLLLVLPLIVLGQKALPNRIRIGAIVESGDESHINIMRRAVERINRGNMFQNVELTLDYFIVKPHDSFQAAKMVCELLESQVWAIISSRSESIGWYARSLADKLRVPHLSVHWDYRSSYRYNVNDVHRLSRNESLTLSLYPDMVQLSKAYIDLVRARNLKAVTVIYESHEGLIEMKDILGLSNDPRKRKIKINFVQFNTAEASQKGDAIQIKKIIKSLKRTDKNLVINLSPDKVLMLLREARAVGRMTEYDDFLIMTMDFHRLDLSEFEDGRMANITGFSMLSPADQPRDLVHDELVYVNSFRYTSPRRARSIVLTTTEALIYDAITLFAQALYELDHESPQSVTEPFLSCRPQPKGEEKRWAFGLDIVQKIKQSSISGISGPIRFDANGHRINFTLDVLQLKLDGIQNVAKWTIDDGILSSANYTPYNNYQQILDAMKTKVFIVTVPLNTKPYVYMKENHHELEGNDKFEGFCVDLLSQITDVMRSEFNSDFDFKIQIVADLKYGQPDKESGDWDGMLGELMRHQSDIAMGDLTATYLRETAVDFTMPFMNLGIAILFKKPSLPEPELFSFLKPFSTEVWFYLGSAYLGVSLLLWMLSRITPYEWVSPHACDPEPLELVNQFTIGNAAWFAIGSLMQQGSDLGPRALSTRTLASVWWFFVLILISSYTANLAASLTLSMMSPAISNVEDLAKQTAIQYGCKRGGSTYEFFQNSNHSTFQRMFNYMEANPEVYINRLDDAIERVRKGGYAYLAESSTIEYLVQRQCDLAQVGTWLDSKGYGLALPQDSPYRTPISNAIVVLQDRGILYKLKKKWWEDRGGGKCPGETKASLDLDIANVGGAFMVLGAGVAFGACCGLLEFVWKTMKVARHERPSIARLIWIEVIRICTGGSSSRPVMSAAGSRSMLNQLETRDRSKTPAHRLRRNESQGSSMSTALSPQPLLKFTSPLPSPAQAFSPPPQAFSPPPPPMRQSVHNPMYDRFQMYESDDGGLDVSSSNGNTPSRLNTFRSQIY